MPNKPKAIFKLADGTVLTCMPGDYQAVLDRRGNWEPPQRVWEIMVAGHVVRRLWPEHVVSWDLEPVL